MTPVTDGIPIDLGTIPYKVLVSMEAQHERRKEAMAEFARLGLQVEWRVPVKLADIPWGVLPPAYVKHPKYASQVITLLEIMEDVERKGAWAFMHLEDDIVFHPEFEARLSQIRVPRDWKFIYIGGRNNNTKYDVSPGLVRSLFISDLHAVIIRANMIDKVRRALLNPESKSHWADARIGSLHKEHPAYLCRPNLAWQSVHPNDSGTGPAYSNYYEDGTVAQGQGN